MKTPPPLIEARPGNRRKLPRPTADPATARITPSLDPQSLARDRVGQGRLRGLRVVGHAVSLHSELVRMIMEREQSFFKLEFLVSGTSLGGQEMRSLLWACVVVATLMACGCQAGVAAV